MPEGLGVLRRVIRAQLPLPLRSRKGSRHPSSPFLFLGHDAAYLAIDGTYVDKTPGHANAL